MKNLTHYRSFTTYRLKQIFLFLVLPILATSQNSNEQDFNLQTYTAGSLLEKKQIDITLFNSIYTETKQNWLGSIDDGYRVTFSTSTIQFLYGVSKKNRINLGGDINLRASARNSSNDFGNIWTPFKLNNNDSLRAGVASLGPKVKFNPFVSDKNFTIQSTFLVSLAKHPEGGRGYYWIEWDRFIWWNQFFYSYLFANNKLQLFSELDLLFRLKKHSEQVSLIDFPASVFLSYFPNARWTFSVMGQHVPRFVADPGTSNDWPLGANYSQFGFGTKYQPSSYLTLELLWTDFFRGKNSGLGSTYNLGIKYIIR